MSEGKEESQLNGKTLPTSFRASARAMPDITTLNFQRSSSQMSAVMKFLAVFVLFIFFFLMLLQMHVSNVDLWWHLATGKYIVENRALPQADPFSYTTHGEKSILLTGYWLAQVIFYEAYKFSGPKGIVILRAMAITLFLLFVYLTMRKRRIPYPFSLFFLLVLFWYSLIIEGERPQVFTILFFALVYFLLEDFRITGSKRAYCIPFIVLILANMHPGYIVCILLVSLYLFGEGLRLLLKRADSRDAFKTLLVLWVATLVLSSINPNGVDALITMVSSQLFTKGSSHVVEFLPTFYLYSKKIVPLDYPYIFLLFTSSILTLRYARKMSLVHLVLVSVFSFMSFVAYRYVVFYLCVMTPIVAGLMNNLRDERICSRLSGKQWIREGFLAGLSLALGVLLLVFSLYSLKGFKSGENVFFHVPKGAADFLSTLKIKGNMFNDYNFGGYLIWRLYPEKKVFVDTRGLDYEVVEEYQMVAYAADTPRWSWKDIINKYNISHVLIKPLWPNGTIVPVVEQLLDSDEWALIYADHLCLIFVRDDGRNAALVEKYRLDKKRGMDTIIAQATAWAMGNRGNANYLITLGKVFFKMGRFSDAEKAFVMASQRDPGNPAIAAWLEKVRENKVR